MTSPTQKAPVCFPLVAQGRFQRYSHEEPAQGQGALFCVSLFCGADELSVGKHAPLKKTNRGRLHFLDVIAQNGTWNLKRGEQVGLGMGEQACCRFSLSGLLFREQTSRNWSCYIVGATRVSFLEGTLWWVLKENPKVLFALCTKGPLPFPFTLAILGPPKKDGRCPSAKVGNCPKGIYHSLPELLDLSRFLGLDHESCESKKFGRLANPLGK